MNIMPQKSVQFSQFFTYFVHDVYGVNQRQTEILKLFQKKSHKKRPLYTLQCVTHNIRILFEEL
jgi:hypothetical protein